MVCRRWLSVLLDTNLVIRVLEAFLSRDISQSCTVTCYPILFLPSIKPVIYAASNSVFRGEFCKVAVLVENVKNCT